MLILFWLLSLDAHAFTLNNSANLVFKKDEVNIYVAENSCTRIGIDERELLSILSDAANSFWNKSPTSKLKLRAHSVVSVANNFKTDVICNSSPPCNPNPNLSVPADILVTCNNNAANFQSSSILATTVPNNISNDAIIGSLIMINDQVGNSFATKSRAEKVSIMAHELGHTFGLGHSPVSDSLMYYQTISKRKNLGADDIDGITYLYPKEQPVSCGSISDKNNSSPPHYWGGLLFGFLLMAFATRIFKTST